MDFYTLKTTVNLTTDGVMEIILRKITFFCQPDFVGDSYKDGKTYQFRFAVRDGGLMDREETVVGMLGESEFNFTVKNTTLERAERV